MMVEVKIKDLIAEQISGEWGNEPKKGEGVFVIRTTNFQNDGKLNLEDVVKRDIPEKKIVAKRLQKGDVIIEKSGGSPDQPVGRVVFFNEDTDKTYLTNNFTTILRPNTDKVHPLYFHYLMMRNYELRKVLKFQNKTTGIINLKLERYLNSKVKIHPDLEIQKVVSQLFSTIDNLIIDRETIGKLYQELLPSLFLNLFGDPVLGRDGFREVGLEEVTDDIFLGLTSKVDYVDKPGFPLIRATDINGGVLSFDKVRYISDSQHKRITKNRISKRGDLLVSKSGSLGTCAVVDTDREFTTYESIITIQPKKKFLDVYFLMYLIRNENFQIKMLGKKVGGTVGHLNLKTFRSTTFYLPPFNLQKEFSNLVSKINSLNNKNSDSTIQLKKLKLSLEKDVFDGNLNLNQFVSTGFGDKDLKIDEVKKIGEKYSEFSFEESSNFNDNIENEDLEPLTGINYAWPPRKSEEEINDLLAELDIELKLRKEVPCVAEYIKYRIIKEKLSKTFAFEDLWKSIENTPFVEHPTYDMLRNWIFEEISSNKMTQKLDGRGGKKKLKLQLI